MTLAECPVCSGKELTNVLTVKDHLVSGENFELSECNTCSLRFTNPRPETEDLVGYYKSEAYISHSNEATTLVDKIYKIARVFTLRKKRKLLEKLSHQRDLLDIGCGTGHFIEHCKKHNWQVTGVEPNADARNQASSQVTQNIYSSIEEIKDQQFDVITLWHVLEHLPELSTSIIKISELLKKDGVLIIAVPNYLSWEEQIFLENWAAYDVPRHLYHFTPNSIEMLMRRRGMKVDNTYPMRLDSYYISLLSNKQKYGKNKYLKSFITGLLSNIYAIKSNNYSSLIYQISLREE